MMTQDLTTLGTVTIMARRALGTMVAGLALLLVGVSASTATEPPKVAVCHFGEGTWTKLIVDANATTAHLTKHDDAFPGGTTSQTGTPLDADCRPGLPPPATPPSCLDCLEVVPNGVFLPGLGAQYQLRAFLVDANGVRTPVEPTWDSSNPAHVVVAPGGLAEAVSNVGSSQITAASGGRISAPVLAMVAQPVAGALLIDDMDVEGTITPVDPTAPYKPGWQYRVQLKNVIPGQGQIVIGTGQIPIAGRTVSVAPAAGGLVDVVLESVAAPEAFTAFAIQQTFALTQLLPAPAAPVRAPATGGAALGVPPGGGKSGGTTAPWQAENSQPRTASSLGTVEFDLGPFTCEASLGGTLGNPFTLDAFSFDITPNLEIEVDVDLTGVNKAVMTGSIAPQLMVNPVTQVDVSGQVACKKLLKILPLPITGAASMFFGARVALGVGFGMQAELPVGGFGVDLLVNGTASVTAGVERAAGTYSFIGDIDGSAGGFLKPVLPSAQDGWGQVEVSFSGFGWAEFRIGGPIEETQATLLEASVGLKQKAELASEKNQALDPAFAGSFGLDFFAEAKTGTSLELIGAFLGTDLLEFTSEYESPLGKSPTGTFTITPASVRAGTTSQLGEKATFTINLTAATVSYLGIESVESVEIRWLKDDGAGNMVLANGRPGCTSLPAASGQTQFTCQTDFLEEHSGTQTFYAFVKAKLFGVTIPILLEIASDAKATVTVTTVAVTVSPATATLNAGQTQQFTATVTGTSDPSVTWSAPGGTISSSGLFTAGATAGTFTVTATSNADPSKQGTATVTVQGGGDPNPVPPGTYAGTIVQRYTVSGQGSTETEYEVRWNVRVPTVRSSGPATGTATYMRVDREYYQASAGSPPCLLRTITQEGDLPVNYYNGKYTGNDPNLFGFGTYFTTAGGTIITTIEVTDCLGNPSTSVGSRTELASTAGSLGNYISFTYPMQVSDANGVTSLTWNYSYSTQYVSDSVTGRVDRY